MAPEQCEMARAGVGFGARELASAAGVTPETVVPLEKGETLRPRTLDTIRAALESASITFIPTGPGMRSRRDDETGSRP
jgi:DNA-binding XRE family transcriptional regulator